MSWMRGGRPGSKSAGVERSLKRRHAEEEDAERAPEQKRTRSVIVARPPPGTFDERAFLIARGYALEPAGKLGSGKYSKVVKALETRGDGDDPVAIKIIDLNNLRPNYFSRFLTSELSILYSLSHPHILHLYSYFSAGPRWYLVLEFAAGGDLLSYVQSRGAVPEHRTRLWMAQLVSAVHYLHSKSIAHRDIKLENILLTHPPRSVKLGDFGFSKKVGPGLSETYCGSKAYSCHEILQGIPFCPLSGDVFALGVVAFILLSGRMPFLETQPLQQLIACHRERRYRFPARLDISPRAMQIVDWMLSFQATQRPNLQQLQALDWLRSPFTPPAKRKSTDENKAALNA